MVIWSLSIWTFQALKIDFRLCLYNLANFISHFKMIIAFNACYKTNGFEND